MGLKRDYVCRHAVLKNLWLTYNPQFMIQHEPQKDWSNSKRCELSHLSVQSLHASITKFYMTYCVPLSWCWEQAQLAVEGGACFTFRKKKAVVLSCPIFSLRSVNLLQVLGTSFRSGKTFDPWAEDILKEQRGGGCKDTTLVLLWRVPLGEGWRWFVEALRGSLSCHSLGCACFLR